MPAELMSLKEWKDGTALGLLHRRGERLRAVDTALERYHGTPSTDRRKPLWEVIQALETYRLTRPGGFVNYQRNKNHIIEALMNQIFAVTTQSDANAEFVEKNWSKPYYGLESWALKASSDQAVADAIRDERDNRLKQIFNESTQVTFRWDRAGLLQYQTLKAAGKAAKPQTTAQQTAAKLHTAMQVHGHLASHLGISQHALAEFIPVLGVVLDVIKTGLEFKALYDLHAGRGTIKGASRTMTTGSVDLTAAIAGVSTYLEQRIKRQAALTALQTSKTVTKAVGVLLDGGSGTAIAANVVSLIAKSALELIVINMEYEAMQSVLDAGGRLAAIDATLFERCPILAAQMVTVVDQSDLLNIFDNGKMSQWWLGAAIYNARQLDGFRSLCRRFLKESYIQIGGGPLVSQASAEQIAENIRNVARMHTEGRIVGIGSDAADKPKSQDVYNKLRNATTFDPFQRKAG